eukprot:9215243-Pyramimonas_sp.AAC.2
MFEWCPSDLSTVMLQHFDSINYERSIQLYAAQVLLALEHLHGCGYVYSDLKLENVLVRQNGSIYLWVRSLIHSFVHSINQLHERVNTSRRPSFGHRKNAQSLASSNGPVPPALLTALLQSAPSNRLEPSRLAPQVVRCDDSVTPVGPSGRVV